MLFVRYLINNIQNCHSDKNFTENKKSKTNDSEYFSHLLILRPRCSNQILKKIVTRYRHVFRYINESSRFFCLFQ